MAGDLKEKLAAALNLKPPKPASPPCYIQQVFDRYKRSMSGLVIQTPLPETVHLRDENFPYWIKLQWHNPQTKTWQDAKASKVLPLLESGTFDEKGYQLEDPRRARILPYLPNLLRNPDKIYRNQHDRVCGDYVYVQAHRGQTKVAFTMGDEQLSVVIVTSSFQTTPRWLAKCVQDPPVYTRPQKR